MLKRIFVPLLAVCAMSTTSLALAAGETYVKLVTSAGNIELELNSKKPLLVLKTSCNMLMKVITTAPLSTV